MRTAKTLDTFAELTLPRRVPGKTAGRLKAVKNPAKKIKEVASGAASP